MEKAFEENKVLLWGVNAVSKSMLSRYDKGNKNPNSTARIKTKKEEAEEEKKPKKAVKVARVFDMEGDYGIEDLDFLNKEYDRINAQIDKGGMDIDEENELYDKQDKLYELIEGLEQMKKISGGAINKKIIKDDIEGTNIFEKTMKKPMEYAINKMIGHGFIRGSPEAIAHAEKMRKALEAKKGVKQVPIVVTKQESKARAAKGSEAAKELGRRLAEARKKKNEAKKAEEQKEREAKEAKEAEEKKRKLKPWYYIGDIPKGYREATEDEAISHKMVSNYGKYPVDLEKWRIFDEYGILLSVQNRSMQEIGWVMNGIKRRIMEALEEIEINKSKLENVKYKDKRNMFESRLAQEKDKRKVLQAGWNWFNKYISQQKDIPYEKQKFKLEKKEVEPVEELKNKKTYVYKPPEPFIDPRILYKKQQGEEIEEKPKKIHKTVSKKLKEYHFIREKDNKTISLNVDYFDENKKLLPKYAKRLFDMGILLNVWYYRPEDLSKYFFNEKIEGSGLVFREIKKLN